MEKQEKPHPHCLRHLYQEGKVFLQKLQIFFEKLIHLILRLKSFLEKQWARK